MGAWLLLVCCAGVRYGGPNDTPGVTLDPPAPPREEPAAAGAAMRAGASVEAEPPGADSPPDPRPLVAGRQWEYVVRYAGGELSVKSVVERRFDRPRATARRMGRFAIELWIGRELVDRVRFDFPLLAAEPAPQGDREPYREPPSFAIEADVTQTVLVPASDRARRALLVDRATGRSVELDWPPDRAARDGKRASRAEHPAGAGAVPSAGNRPAKRDPAE
jgi:hypothetical protein